MEYENEYEEMVCDFKRYAKQTLDLLVDAYKWKTMARYCDDDNMRMKYMQVSNTLFDLFMKEHNAMGEIFKSEE